MSSNWIDPDDAPELTDEWFAKATLMEGGVVIREGGRQDGQGGGRPRGSTKEQVTLRLDKAILEHFRATGPGWQTRLNEALAGLVKAG